MKERVCTCNEYRQNDFSKKDTYLKLYRKLEFIANSKCYNRYPVVVNI